MTTSFDLPRVRALVLRVAPRSRAEPPAMAPEQAVASLPLAAAHLIAPPESAVGAALRAERLRRGLTLGDCEAQLHVRARFLAAIEGDRDDDLPAPAYARIFARSYATFLGLDAAAMTRELDRRAGDTTWREHATIDPEPIATGRIGELIEVIAGWTGSRRTRVGCIAVAVALAVSMLVWLGYRAESRPAAPNIIPTTLGPANLAPPTPVPAAPAGATQGAAGRQAGCRGGAVTCPTTR